MVEAYAAYLLLPLWRRTLPLAGRHWHRPHPHACPLCGVALIGHPRCRACGFLAGAGHASTLRADGCCQSCTGHRVRHLEVD